jgi:hypothetical protein
LLLKLYFQSFCIDFDPTSKRLVGETLFDSIKQNTQQKGKKRNKERIKVQTKNTKSKVDHHKP